MVDKWRTVSSVFVRLPPARAVLFPQKKKKKKKIPGAGLMWDVPEHKWVPSCHICLISVLCLQLTEESRPRCNIRAPRSFDLLVSVLQLTSFISLPLLSLPHVSLVSYPSIHLPACSTSWKSQLPPIPPLPVSTTVPAHYSMAFLSLICERVFALTRSRVLPEGRVVTVNSVTDLSASSLSAAWFKK